MTSRDDRCHPRAGVPRDPDVTSRIPVRKLLQFIVQVRKLSAHEGNEKRTLAMIRNLANQMYRDHVGYDHRGDFRIKGKDEAVFSRSVAARSEFLGRFRSRSRPEGILQITFLGHSGFLIRGSRTVIIDPDITHQIHRPLDLSVLPEVDAVLVTQEHRRYRGDALEIARTHGATLISPPGTFTAESSRGIEKKPLNLGGKVALDDLEISMVEARHITTGSPAVGYVIQLDGFVVYHMGATAYFEELKWIRDTFSPHVVFVPVGGRYTMGSRDAARAVETLQPLVAIPMQFASASRGESDSQEFAYHVGETSMIRILRPGRTWELDLRREPDDESRVPGGPQRQGSSPREAERSETRSTSDAEDCE